MKKLGIFTIFGATVWLFMEVIGSESLVEAGELLDIIGAAFLVCVFGNEVFSKEEPTRFNNVMKVLALLVIVVGIILRGSIF